MNKPWKKSHDPEARPLGCNGRYGQSGAYAHRKKGKKVCRKCRASGAHYQRERRRGALLKPQPLKPCGTSAAAARHRARGEELDFACRLALAEEQQRFRDARRAASDKVPAKGPNSPYSEGTRTLLAMTCKNCHRFLGGNHFPLRNLGKRNQYRRRICNSCAAERERDGRLGNERIKVGLQDLDQAPA